MQFASGTSLESAHGTAHELQDLISERLRGADVLIHLEPEDRVRPGEVLGRRSVSLCRLIAAETATANETPA